MKAVRFHDHGARDVLSYEEVATPSLVSIRVRACALNYLDLWQRCGIPSVSLSILILTEW